MKKQIYLGFFVLLMSLYLVAAESIDDALESGATRTYSINNVEYNLLVVFINPYSAVKFEINGEFTPTLYKGDSYQISEGIALEIMNFDSYSGRDRVYFIITYELESLCGNDICDISEDCSSCETDCSCQEGFVCEAKQCVKECPETVGCDSCLNKELGEGCDCNDECESDVCWADICVTHYCGDETCNADENYTICEKDCQPPAVCGDNICDSNEKDCCIDCGCASGYDCINNACISLDECSSDYDCNDYDNCTNDICSGTPKKCSYTSNQSCVKQNETKETSKEEPNSMPEEKEIEIQSNNDTNRNVTFEVSKETVKEENVTNETMLIEQLREKESEKQNIFQKIIKWVLNLFR